MGDEQIGVVDRVEWIPGGWAFVPGLVDPDHCLHHHPTPLGICTDCGAERRAVVKLDPPTYAQKTS